jgi:hypothetical protein
MEQQAQIAALRLAQRPGRGWRAAAAAVSRIGRPMREPALAGRAVVIAGNPMADKEA